VTQQVNDSVPKEEMGAEVRCMAIPPEGTAEAADTGFLFQNRDLMSCLQKA
jgi:hypothetical protein